MRRTNRLAASAALFLAVACASACAAASSADSRETPAANAAVPSASVAPSLAPSGPAPTHARALQDPEQSPEALARVVLRAIADGDDATLLRKRVTKDEFCHYLWPDLPGSKVPNVSCDFAWDQATLRSTAGLGRVLGRDRGKRYELVSMRYAGGVTEYASFKVYNKAVLTVRDETGVEREAYMFGSILELDGQYKLFGYAVP